MKKTLVIVSFGTSVPQAEKSIRAVEQALMQEASGWEFARAYTSPTIRGILAKRGQPVPSLEELLEQLAAQGEQEIFVQPTHVLYGIEYDKIRDSVEAFAPRFAKIRLGRPLLSGTEDLKEMADCISANCMPEEGALVLMGHGTDHLINMTYPAMQTALRMQGEDRAFVGTVSCWPTIEDVLEQLKKEGFRKVTLMPLMLVAGEHARSDMSGPQPDSWKSILEAAGIEVHCRLEGMGEMACVQEMYRRHLREEL